MNTASVVLNTAVKLYAEMYIGVVQGIALLKTVDRKGENNG